MNIYRSFAAVVMALLFPCAQALELQLKDSDFGPNHMGFAADGARACLASDHFDPDAAQNGAELTVVDYQRNAVLWTKRIAAPNGFASLRAKQCVFDGDNVYLLANANTRSQSTLNQTLVYVYRFDVQGKELGHKELSLPGRNRYGYAIGASPFGVVVAGYSKDEDGDAEYNSTFTVSLDKKLGVGTVSLRKTGAFASSAAARFVGDQLYIAGEFVPAKLNKQDYAIDYAQSRILSNGGYAWSVRPFKQEYRSVEAVVSPRGLIYSLSSKGSTSTLAVTSAEGKQLSLTSFDGKFCRTQSISEYGNGVIAVREPCSGQGKTAALLSIAPADGKEVVQHLVSGEPVFVATHNEQWFIVAKDGTNRFFLHSGAIKE
ncbi:hypothetical protein [Pseudoduganella violaceinigra]|uniref:hypothetical protein n=1 Tax=Pseudoduganella violaceinigra TaxID=246602 RepID=UPI000405076A|nr:hypothetical protein [Pseudoduganella violaceinigra]